MTPLTSSLLAGLGGASRAPLPGTTTASEGGAPNFSALLREQAKAPAAPPAPPAPVPQPTPAKAAEPAAQRASTPRPAEGKTAEARARQNEAAHKKAQSGAQGSQGSQPAPEGQAAQRAAAGSGEGDTAAETQDRTQAGVDAAADQAAQAATPGIPTPLTPGQVQASVQALLGETVPTEAAAQAALAQGAAPGQAAPAGAESADPTARPAAAGGTEALKGTGGRGPHEAHGGEDLSTESAAAGRAGRGEDAGDGRQLTQTAEKDGAAAPSFAARLEQAQSLPAESLRALHGAQGSAAAETQAARNSPAVALAQPLHSSEFAPEMAARVSVLAAEGVQRAELHLNPAEMGPVQVQIVVDGQQAQVSFMSDQAETRAVLERGLPELASALRDSGLTLSGGGVFQQPREQRDPSAQQQSGEAQGRGAGRGEAGGTAAGTEALAAAPRPAARTRGVVDVYA
ncbi:UNVERIFIED_ORG: flagellar hook-length control protein FliK [Shinella sp. XGS7]|nr:flagellar hook-length control protein FliK [Shinella sp. XGS7]